MDCQQCRRVALTMWNKLKNLYLRPSPLEVAIRELEEAQYQVLIAQTSLEYSKAMVTYNEARILRLKAFIKFPG